MELKRKDFVNVYVCSDNEFEVKNRMGNTLLGRDDDYYIYMKDIRFKKGYIQGIYLGETSDKILDGYCRMVSYDEDTDKWIQEDGKKVVSARMLAVHNKTGVIIIIQED